MSKCGNCGTPHLSEVCEAISSGKWLALSNPKCGIVCDPDGNHSPYIELDHKIPTLQHGDYVQRYRLFHNINVARMYYIGVFDLGLPVVDLEQLIEKIACVTKAGKTILLDTEWDIRVDFTRVEEPIADHLPKELEIHLCRNEPAKSDERTFYADYLLHMLDLEEAIKRFFIQCVG